MSYQIMLKQHRLKAGLSLRQLANDTGISKSTLNNIENGVTDPHVSTIVTLAKFFCCNLSELINF